MPANASVATVRLVVWDNEGGTIPTWIAAVIGNVPEAASLLFNLSHIGGTVNSAPDLIGLQSVGMGVIPEPSSIVLLSLGALTAIASHRLARKSDRRNLHR